VNARAFVPGGGGAASGHETRGRVGDTRRAFVGDGVMLDLAPPTSGGIDMASVIVETVFEEPVSDEELGRIARRADPCLELRGSAWVRTSLSKDRMRMICEFEGPDAESIRQALRSAGHSFERAWAAHVFPVEQYPERAEQLQNVRDTAIATKAAAADVTSPIGAPSAAADVTSPIGAPSPAADVTSPKT
jgi:hypothetical protein